MLTHYAKQRPKPFHDWDAGTKLSAAESLLYSVAPSDVLFTQEVLLTSYLNAVKSKPEEYKGFPKKSVDLQDNIKRLAEKGYFKEINGVRLARWLETF
jgi:hypothetical protein